MVERLLDGEHPHDDSRIALTKLKDVYKADRERLLSLDEAAKDDTVLEHCRHANVNLVRLKKFVGFLLRSTNIRNAFELYFPIRLLATEVLGKAAPVVLGSEWEFSPYTYPAALDELPDFIFIGIPASECQNPLILPLAGHELGHVVWRRQGGQAEFDPKILACVIELYRANWDEFRKHFNIADDVSPDELATDLFLQRIWSKSYQLARTQLEELFCDSLGVYLFGQSFLHSFRYLLSPNLGQFRALGYPRISVRAQFMLDYAESVGVANIEGFVQAFDDADQPLTSGDAFIVKIADGVVERMHKELSPLVEKYKGTAKKFSGGQKEERGAIACLRSLVPPASVDSIAAIVNAAWGIRLELDGWRILEHVTDEFARRSAKQRILTDLVLKTFEIYEYSKRVGKHAA